MEAIGTARDRSRTRPSIFHKQRVIFPIFNLATFVEYFNVQFLFASMRGLEMSLGFSPEMLSRFAMVEELSLVSFIPVWGILSDIYELKYLLGFALFMSGTLSVVLSLISNYGFMLFIRILNGATMGSVTPSTQKYVVGMKSIDLGLAFGILHATMCAARLICSILITKLASTVFFGIYGWRICSLVFGIFCIMISPLLLLMPKFHRDLPPDPSDTEKVPLKLRIQKLLKFLYNNLREAFRTTTSKILLVLIFFSDGPFLTFSFITLYFQYEGLSDLRAGVSTGLIIIGGLVGGVIGGFTSDYLHKRSEKYGRLIFGIVATAVRMVSLSTAFYAFNRHNVYQFYPILAKLLFLIGASFATVSCVDRAILADVVHPRYQSSAIGFCRCIAGIGSSITFAPLLGILIERVYGYVPITIDLKYVPMELIEKNAYALRNSIMIVNVGTTFIVLLLYIVLCFSFGADAECIREKTRLKEREVSIDL
ncbi:hypothetical protein BEWA_033080 [Theileria equi strain WA]|uniref:Major facilitator superfamily (MFS) profile domain-containing protein n=1 Tax=Theileria equi strain WA TaxID=1537102 RepID=L0AY23_THEEQ|nr:hypothetical protein BEWA_033080 [Theileria equi strain WA]AFZ80455.1 hypothetical protein BEWA_033080 [Theileria equi strain WA]|eukprot:XP_004830121.1 hypothetical protein BEWA_033080 [Theileria equi strain WA]